MHIPHRCQHYRLEHREAERVIAAEPVLAFGREKDQRVEPGRLDNAGGAGLAVGI